MTVSVSEAYREDNFTVGLTNESPATTRPTPGDYTLCGQWDGPVPRGQTVHLDCDANLPAFRYVIFQVPNDAVSVCELEVYGSGNQSTVKNSDWATVTASTNVNINSFKCPSARN